MKDLEGEKVGECRNCRLTPPPRPFSAFGKIQCNKVLIQFTGEQESRRRGHTMGAKGV